MKPLLQIRNLSVSFRSSQNTVRAVSSLSLEVKKGDSIAIVGESGSGKSMSMQAVLGLIDEPNSEVSSEGIYFEGNNLLDLSSKEMQKIRGKDISLIFQDPMSALNPTMTVGRQVSEVLEYHFKFSKSDARKKTLQLFHELDIPDPHLSIDQYPFQLSGGMKQRVCIAMAIACEPKLLIADEPTTALDSRTQKQILSLLYRVRGESTLILITHDLTLAEKYCEQIYVMYAGEFVEWGNTEEVLHNPSHPYTQGLLKALPQNDLEPILGSPPDLAKIPSGCSFHPRCPHAMKICPRKEPPATASKNSAYSCWLAKKGEHE